MYKILTDCWDKRGVKRVIRKPKQHTGFANSWISNKQKFKEQIIGLLGHLACSFKADTPSIN